MKETIPSNSDGILEFRWHSEHNHPILFS
ncbi:uncharacterized protein METZ01_LOCUS135226, partial [marine metagenome]